MKKYLLAAIPLLGAIVNLAVAGAAPPAKSLTIKASPDPVVFGRAVAFGGQFTGSGTAGKTVQVQADRFPYEGHFTTVASPVTSANGSWAAGDVPPVNTRYRARQGKTISP